MSSDRLSRHLIIAFALALGLYVFGYWFIESRRVKHTPWQVDLAVDESGHPQLTIRQESLALGPVQIRFAAAGTNAPLAHTNLFFTTPRPVPYALPAGECVFADLTFLPGTVVIQLDGAKIQMLPRVLTIGTNEFPWAQTRVLEIQADGRTHVIE